MSHFELVALDDFFIVFHTLLVLFNILGWIWKRTRRAHLITMAVTAFSWFVMGLRYGVGYCICTDWHWQVRQALGYHDQARTYIQFLVQRLTGFMPGYEVTRWVSGIVFAAAAILSIGLNLRDRRIAKQVKAS